MPHRCEEVDGARTAIEAGVTETLLELAELSNRLFLKPRDKVCGYAAYSPGPR